MTTLFEKLTGWREQQIRKHGLTRTAEEEINALSNYDFLRELSDALEALLPDENK